ncbi:hypothetical protein NKH82_34210, partial [Mesorhizobium sp. M0915]|uniref:hypothetical protein n=1 Tax=Mesorhizobium sp. M0915 TaxID=2957027 RepID=UPI0033360457
GKLIDLPLPGCFERCLLLLLSSQGGGLRLRGCYLRQLLPCAGLQIIGTGTAAAVEEVLERGRVVARRRKRIDLLLSGCRSRLALSLFGLGLSLRQLRQLAPRRGFKVGRAVGSALIEEVLERGRVVARRRERIDPLLSGCRSRLALSLFGLGLGLRQLRQLAPRRGFKVGRAVGSTLIEEVLERGRAVARRRERIDPLLSGCRSRLALSLIRLGLGLRQLRQLAPRRGFKVGRAVGSTLI